MKLGIDFGTCFSFIATCKPNGKPYPLAGGDDNERIYDIGGGIPTVFFHDANHYEIMGKIAADRRIKHPEYGVVNIKKVLRDKSSFDLVFPLGIEGNNQYEYPAKYIVVKFIKFLIDNAIERFRIDFPSEDSNLENVVIAVPAASTHWYKKFTRECAAEATEEYQLTMDKIKLIPEPVAAALSYFENNPGIADGTRILVYDLGGGTFDTAIVEYDSSQWRRFNIIAHSGDTQIGGTDWDKELFKHVITESGHSNSIFTETQKCEIEQKVIEAKIRLSTEDSTDFSYYHKEPKIMVFADELTQEKFKELTKDKLDRTLSRVNLLIDEYREKYGSDAKIDTIVLTGGASRMPMVREALDEFKAMYPGLNIHSERPDRAIAFGAAIYAAADFPPLMVVPHTYGVVTTMKQSRNDKGVKRIRNILFKGTKIESEHSDREYISSKVEGFTPTESTQKTLTVRVYESDESHSKCINVGKPKFHITFPFETLSNITTTERKFDVEIGLDSNGILEVHVFDKNLNKEIGCEVGDL